tara:strand:+ start:2126 stop:2905 length:780 start_codon:yes stop_codon:yes gene_type:complete
MKLKDLKNMIKESMSGKSVLLAKPEVLSEANYGNVKRKIEVEMVPFVMISAFRGGLSRRENIVRQRKLEEYVAGAGFPWTKMPDSGYVEDPTEPEELEEPQEEGEAEFEAPEEETPEEETPEGVEVKENSILIWEQTRPDKGERGELGLSLFELAKFLAKKYDQDSFIYGEPVEGAATGRHMEILPYDKKGEKLDWGVSWSSLKQIDDDDLYWSSIGSKKAKLVELLNKYQKMPVKNRLDAMKKQHYLDVVKSALKRVL